MKPDYKKLYKIVCDLFIKSKHFDHGHWDETFFTMRVFEWCKKLIRRTSIKVNEEVVLVAALFHDVGKSELNTLKKIKTDWEKHPLLGARITERILREQGFDDAFINKVVYLVKHHDDKPHKIKMRRTNELMILQDADLLADMGLVGVVRPFLYSGKMKRPTIENINYMRDALKYNSFLSEHALDSLNLEESKRIAKELLKKSTGLIKEIVKLTDSELLK